MIEAATDANRAASCRLRHIGQQWRSAAQRTARMPSAAQQLAATMLFVFKAAGLVDRNLDRSLDRSLDRNSYRYSHSIVDGGLELMSYTRRLMPRTELIIRVEMRARRSCGNGYQSAVMKSSD